MPMYYPDFKSVKRACKNMKKYQRDDKKYTGIIPKNKSELPQARLELGKYFRKVWNDEIAAIEVEQSATQENYEEAIMKGISIYQ